MNDLTREALAGAEMVDPSRYDVGITYSDLPGGEAMVYGIAPVELPDSVDVTAPEDVPSAVRVEDVYDNDAGVQTVVTMLLEEEGVDEDSEAVHAEFLFDKRGGGEMPNRVLNNPGEMRDIVRAVMEKWHLERITTNEEAVANVVSSERYRTVAQFLGQAGFIKIESPDSEASDTYELRIPSKSTAEEVTPETVAA